MGWCVDWGYVWLLVGCVFFVYYYKDNDYEFDLVFWGMCVVCCDCG